MGILNSDDIYAHNTVLEKVAEIFSNPDTQALYADLQYVEPDNLDSVVRYWKSNEFDSQNFYYGWMPPHPTFFVRRKLYEECGVFNTTFKSSADYELMLRILVKHQFKADYLDEVLVKMRTGGFSNSSWGSRMKANIEDRMAWKINDLKPYFFTLYLKPFRKLFQFLHINQLNNVKLRLSQFL